MKKLISTLAAVALVFTMAMPVMAAESPEPHGQDIVPNGSVDGYYVRISDPNPTDYALEVLPDAAAAAVGEDVIPECSLDAVDVDIVNLQGTAQIAHGGYAVAVLKNDSGALQDVFERDV